MLFNPDFWIFLCKKQQQNLKTFLLTWLWNHFSWKVNSLSLTSSLGSHFLPWSHLSFCVTRNLIGFTKAMHPHCEKLYCQKAYSLWRVVQGRALQMWFHWQRVSLVSVLAEDRYQLRKKVHACTRKARHWWLMFIISVCQHANLW